MRLWPDLLFAGGRELSRRVVTIANGRITAVEPAGPADASELDRTYFSDRVRGVVGDRAPGGFHKGYAG